MAIFDRKEYTAKKDIKRIQPDMRVVAGVGALKQFQAIAQNKTDGKFYAYVAKDANKGIIAGLYTGEDITAKDGDSISISTLAIIAKEEIHGVDWDTDFTAISQLKNSGIILTGKIEGTKEA